jgi:hypothetical protein
VREAFGLAAHLREVVSGIAGALNLLFASAGRRDDDLAEFRGGGIASAHGQSTHGAGELVDLFLLVVALGCQLVRFDKQRVDLGVEQSQRTVARELPAGADHADGERDHH